MRSARPTAAPGTPPSCSTAATGSAANPPNRRHASMKPGTGTPWRHSQSATTSRSSRHRPRVCWRGSARCRDSDSGSRCSWPCCSAHPRSRARSGADALRRRARNGRAPAASPIQLPAPTSSARAGPSRLGWEYGSSRARCCSATWSACIPATRRCSYPPSPRWSASAPPGRRCRAAGRAWRCWPPRWSWSASTPSGCSTALRSPGGSRSSPLSPRWRAPPSRACPADPAKRAGRSRRRACWRVR